MALAVDATDAGQNGAAGTTITLSHTCSGDDRLLIVCAFSQNSNQTITGITYNSIAMTQAAVVTNATYRFAYIWYLIDPATGANDIVITKPSGELLRITGISFTGAHQTDPIGATGSSDRVAGSPTHPEVTVNTNDATGFVVGIAGTRGSVSASDSGQTDFQNASLGITNALAAYESFTGSSNPSIGWTAASDGWGSVGVEIRELASAFKPSAIFY